MEDLKDMIEKEEIFAVYKDEKIIGYAIFNISTKNRRGFYNRKVFMVDSICIDERIRGKGIGKTFMQYLIQYAKEKECTDFELTVSPENEYAIRLYKNLGMRIKNIKYQMKI
jgi:ribosomal protein S18 acetylase RimI-like enzyme